MGGLLKKVFKPVERAISNTAVAVGLHKHSKTSTEVITQPAQVSVHSPSATKGTISCHISALQAKLAEHGLPSELLALISDNLAVSDVFQVELVVANGTSSVTLYATTGTNRGGQVRCSSWLRPPRRR